MIALVLACAKLPLDFLVNVDAAQRSQGFGELVLYSQHYLLRFAVALAISLVLSASGSACGPRRPALPLIWSGTGLITMGSLRSNWFTPARAYTEAVHAFPQGHDSTSDGQFDQTSGHAANPTAIFLVPFLVTLCGGVIASALSSGFESLYVLRPIGAVLGLWWGWRSLRTLNWRCSWRPLFVGVVAFSIWMALAHVLVKPRTIPRGLQAMVPSARRAWITVRMMASVMVVPIEEELAFRWFLMRRLVATTFNALPFGKVGASAVILSAVLYGAEHGALRRPTTLAGLILEFC